MGGMGGGGKGGGGVDAPDFQAIAKQQAELSQKAVNAQTEANRVNQTNAFGASSNWTQGPDGRWTQASTFGGPLGSAIGNLSGQIGAQGPVMTGDQARDQAITSAWDQARTRLDPMFAQQEQSLNARLAAQGLDPTSEAAQASLGNFGRSRNDAYTSALASAIGQGTAAGNSVFQNNLASQMAPYQQLQAIQGLGQQSAVPYSGLAQTPDMLGAAQNSYQAALNTNGQKQAGKNSMMSGIGTLAGGALGTMVAPGVGTMLGAQLGGMAGGAIGNSM